MTGHTAALLRWGFRVAAGVAACGILAVVAVALRTAQLRTQAEEASRRHEKLVWDYNARLAAKPWAPKPLRGAGHPGNIYTEQLSALAALKVPDGLLARASACAPPTQVQLQFFDENGPALLDLRRAARASYSRVPLELDASDSPRMPEILPLVRAQRALLLQSATMGPPQCIEITADALRLGQALSPGGALFSSMVSAGSVEQALRAMVECLRRADPATRAEALRMLELALADHPTFGDGFALEAELLYLSSLATARLSFDFRVPVDGAEREAVWNGGALLEAQAWSLAQIDVVQRFHELAPREVDARWYALRPLGYRDQPAALRRNQLEPDLRTLALMRVVLVFTQRLLESSSDPDGSLEDVFVSGPLHVEQAAGNLRVWSVGPDGLSQDGAGDDVVVEQRSPCP